MGNELSPSAGCGPVLIYAISGLGKSTLAARHPEVVLDADEFLYAAVSESFPDLEPRAQLNAWRDVCRKRPWELGGEILGLWAKTRRAWVQPLVAAMSDRTYRLVVTSLLHPPWVVSAYYGLQRGHYLAHLRQVGREADNRQSEAMNDRLEGYPPLIRLPPGSFLADRDEIQALVEEPSKL
jgi:hypothetical protein